MLLRSTAALMLAALVLGGCGSDDPAGGVLVIEERLDTSGPLYIEGALSFVAVHAGHGMAAFEGRLEERVRLPLPAGEYRLRAWQRPCNGNCSLLDPPTGHCSGRIELDLHATTTVVVTFRPAEACAISGG